MHSRSLPSLLLFGMYCTLGLLQLILPVCVNQCSSISRRIILGSLAIRIQRSVGDRTGVARDSVDVRPARRTDSRTLQAQDSQHGARSA